MRSTIAVLTIIASILLPSVAAEPKPVPILADVKPREKDSTFWNVGSSQVLKDKKLDLLSGGGCNVVAYLSSALKRAQAGSAVEWNTAVDISPQVDMFSRSSHWFSPNGEAPWCSDGGATTDSQWPGGSIPFDSVLDPNEEDALMIVMGRALKKAQHSTRVSY